MLQSSRDLTHALPHAFSLQPPNLHYFLLSAVNSSCFMEALWKSSIYERTAYGPFFSHFQIQQLNRTWILLVLRLASSAEVVVCLLGKEMASAITGCSAKAGFWKHSMHLQLQRLTFGRWCDIPVAQRDSNIYSSKR